MKVSKQNRFDEDPSIRITLCNSNDLRNIRFFQIESAFVEFSSLLI